MSDLVDLSDTDILNSLHEAAGNLSYFNAAEGDVYRMEAGARAAAQKAWNVLVDEALRRGIYDKDAFAEYLV